MVTGPAVSNWAFVDPLGIPGKRRTVVGQPNRGCVAPLVSPTDPLDRSGGGVEEHGRLARLMPGPAPVDLGLEPLRGCIGVFATLGQIAPKLQPGSTGGTDMAEERGHLGREADGRLTAVRTAPTQLRGRCGLTLVDLKSQLRPRLPLRRGTRRPGKGPAPDRPDRRPSPHRSASSWPDRDFHARRVQDRRVGLHLGPARDVASHRRTPHHRGVDAKFHLGRADGHPAERRP